jgi:hypothetical protein
MELLRATALESRSGTPPGRPSEAVSMNDVTQILSAAGHGDARAAEQLLLGGADQPRVREGRAATGAEGGEE